MSESKLDRFDPATLATNPRATQSAWARYEHIVLAAYDSYPAPHLVEVLGFSPETVVSRLRDAIRGKIAFDYPSRLTADEVCTWWSKVIVRRHGAAVYIGPAIKSVKDLEVKPEPKGFTFPALTPMQLRCFAILLNDGLISGPITLTTGPDDNALFVDLLNVEPIRLADKFLLI